MTSEAERLAQALERAWELAPFGIRSLQLEAAAELRRQSAEIARLSAGAQRYAFLRDTWWFAIKPADLGQALTADQLDELIDQAKSRL